MGAVGDAHEQVPLGWPSVGHAAAMLRFVVAGICLAAMAFAQMPHLNIHILAHTHDVRLASLAILPLVPRTSAG